MPDSQPSSRSHIYLGLGFLLVVAGVVATLWLVQAHQSSTKSVQHTLEVENSLFQVFSALQDSETGERGYLITGDRRFLTPYEQAPPRLTPALAELGRLVADNRRQAERVAELQQLATRLLSHQATTIALRQRLATSDILIEVLDGKILMDRARESVSAIAGKEAQLLLARQRDAARLTIGLYFTLGILLVFTIALAVFAYANARRRLAQAVSARDDLAASVALLKAEAAQRHAAEDQVRQLQKMDAIGQLTGGIAHDFNNMLAIVLGSLEMALRRLDTDRDAAVVFINNAVSGAQRAAQLTARLLAFSRRQPLEPQSVDCNKLVSGMSDLLTRTLGEHVRVETVLAGGLWRAQVDPGQLENALLNLCVNSRDAMPEGGKLTIETTNGHLDDVYAVDHAEVVPGQYVVLAVSDTGTGMTKEVSDQAFEPFFTTKIVGQGTGLGLSQVYGFVKQSRGHVKIYSEPGHGTTVKIYLPRDFGETSNTASEPSGLESPRGRNGETILVVEDEEGVRIVTVETLRELGYHVVYAADPNQALDLIKSQRQIDLVLTDIVMPQMNGRRLAELALGERPDLKVVYTTGYTRNAVIHNGMLDPGVAFIAKPFSSHRLAIKIRQVLDGGGANRPL